MSLLCENSINQSNQVPYVAVSYIHRDPAAVLSVISKGVVFFVFVIPPTAFYGGVYIFTICDAIPFSGGKRKDQRKKRYDIL